MLLFKGKTTLCSKNFVESHSDIPCPHGLWVSPLGHSQTTLTRQQARAKGGLEGAKFQICYINLSIGEGVTNPQNSVNVVCESSFSSGWKELKLDTRYGIIT